MHVSINLNEKMTHKLLWYLSNIVLDYHRLNWLFRTSFQISFTNLHPLCRWDKAMCRLIYLIWEFCQMFSIAQQYNGRFTVGPNYQKGRAHLLVTDFRVTGK